MELTTSNNNKAKKFPRHTNYEIENKLKYAFNQINDRCVINRILYSCIWLLKFVTGFEYFPRQGSGNTSIKSGNSFHKFHMPYALVQDLLFIRILKKSLYLISLFLQKSTTM
jgi:hypothetical protein